MDRSLSIIITSEWKKHVQHIFDKWIEKSLDKLKDSFLAYDLTNLMITLFEINKDGGFLTVKFLKENEVTWQGNKARIFLKNYYFLTKFFKSLDSVLRFFFYLAWAEFFRLVFQLWKWNALKCVLGAAFKCMVQLIPVMKHLTWLIS